MPRSVPRAGRLLDLAGAALFLAGAAVYGRAWFALRTLRDFEPAADAETLATMARYNDLTTLSRVGLGLMAAGALVAVAAAVVVRRIRRSSTGDAAAERGE